MRTLRAAGLIGTVCLAGLLALSAGCAASGQRTEGPQLFDGLGTHGRAVSTRSDLARRYFNQGLILAFAFNHDEAIRSFGEAARLDPELAMAWWGVALCNGPHINNPVVPPERAKAAWEALSKARALRDKAGAAEQALIDALSRRYADPPPGDRGPLDAAYAAAMGEVWKAYPTDADIGVLYAESLMDLQPWDLWTKDGAPKGRAEEIVSVLEAVRRLDPDHPGANHLYIHAVEASPHPERAVEAADRLRRAVPSAGHLVHMPGHIYVRVGRWADAAAANERAIEADRRYRARSPRQDFYHVYMAHNDHFLAWVSMMEGRRAAATAAAQRMLAGVPQEWAQKNAALIDGYLPILIEVQMRFGRWDDILAQPEPDAQFPITVALWRFARGVALAAKGDLPAAQEEQVRFAAASAAVPQGAMMAVNPAHQVLKIAAHVLAGEIALRRGQMDDAVRELRAGVELEDGLRYMEPPEWMQPVRHALGAVLVAAKRYEEAEAVYRADLAQWRENGWALHGLTTCLKARGATQEADEVEARFRKAWSRADTRIASSCMCVARAQ